MSHPTSIDPARLSDLCALLARHDIRPRKRLGQNFLVSPEVADRIIQAAQIKPDDHVIEIGAGAGALTLRLARAVAEVVAVELDDRLVALLPDVLVDAANTHVIHADVLKLDFTEVMGEEHWKAVGNLPYSITGPALAKLLEQRHTIDRVVVMVQKEVADRITSPPGGKAYGALSVMLQTYFQVRREFAVKRGSFFPIPEVDSAVVSLTPLAAPGVPPECEAAFKTIVRAAFAHRRKTLENSLVDACVVADRQQASDALTAAELPHGRRAEALSVAEFARLARFLDSTR